MLGCPIELSPGQYCMLCNRVHEPLVIYSRPDWSKTDFIVALIIVTVLAGIVIFLYFRIRETGITHRSQKTSPFGDGWHYRDHAWYYEDI